MILVLLSLPSNRAIPSGRAVLFRGSGGLRSGRRSHLGARPEGLNPLQTGQHTYTCK